MREFVDTADKKSALGNGVLIIILALGAIGSRLIKCKYVAKGGIMIVCGGYRTVTEHFIGRINKISSAKTLIFWDLPQDVFSALVFK